ncbi:leukocyte elastase inhibitor-like [Brachyhypopomus gauderio]|uniref:leukocyte elastase inhibitor-like n=1 Tax=Brachyhypopomus gauderio TaxID=698409 RepID=UPI0040427EBB
MESLSDANTHFNFDLLKKIRESNKSDNVFFSPLSISSALGMVLLGAGGNTAAQMSQCLHFNKIKGDVNSGFDKLLSALNQAGARYTISLANRLYGEKSYKFGEKFMHDTKTHYHAELEMVDFKSNAEAARIQINKWVEQQTHEKIKDLLAKGGVNSATSLVLVNAIYFKGTWVNKFKAQATRELPFKLSKNKTKPVQMMHQTDRFPLAKIPDMRCQILEMPYVGQEVSMFIILPNEIADNTTGLEKLEQTLTYENFKAWTQPSVMHQVQVQMALPRFKLSETYDMKSLLVCMGMVDAFNQSKCDFSLMSSCDDLVLSKVVHKSFVAVDEEGTEAAAATAVMMVGTGRPLTPPENFVADHPFLFFIQHKPTCTILFCGRYCSP